MKILVVFHSKTGNTRKFATMIADRLAAEGHHVDSHELETVEPLNPKEPPTTMNFELRNAPNPQDYDVVIAGSPVWAFRSAPLILKYIMEASTLKGVKLLPIYTMGFPLKGMGGTGAVNQLLKIALPKGAIPLKASIITYMLSKPDLQMERETARISELLR
jgi:flavodoxin